MLDMDQCLDAVRASDAALETLVSTYKQEASLLRAELQSITDRSAELKHKKNELIKYHGGSNSTNSDVLKINAGGQNVTTTRGTLTQLKGSRLEALFSGRWENKLLRDEQGRIFLDVNPACFKSIVDFLNELKISSPDNPPDPPHVSKEDETFLSCLLSVLGIDGFVKPRGCDESRNIKTENDNSGSCEKSEAAQQPWRALTFDDLPENIASVLRKEQQALIFANEELKKDEHSFVQEKSFVEFFLEGDQKDIIWLDVSGKIMAVKRSTIGICEDSILSKQFNDPLWTEQGAGHDIGVDEWDCKQVAEWVSNIDGVTQAVGRLFMENQVNGVALLALERADLKDLGVAPTTTLALVTKAVKRLQETSCRHIMLIEHSDYCFGKLVDQLRLHAMCRAQGVYIPAPRICAKERKRFKRIVEFYFPGESAGFVLASGVRSNFLSGAQIMQIQNWLDEDGVLGPLELIYRASRDGWGASQFHSMCDKQGATVTVIRTTEGFIFGGFSDTSWTSNCNSYETSAKSFVFSLNRYGGIGPTKMKHTKFLGRYAVYHDVFCGPTFGEGHDIHVSDNPHTRTTSYTCVGCTYKCPPEQIGDAFLTGSRHFQAAEIEVFRVVD